jgi:glycerol-3-phosphate dehydrogenase
MVQRQIKSLIENKYDLVIVGAGIFGAFTAWDATLRGLRVAIIDKGDFCSGTSANHFKMVHGGIRYLQHADLIRIRETSRERNALIRIAPHLVHPLPVVIPTYGRGREGKAFLRLGLMAYDFITLDRNKGLHDPDRRIPETRVISKDECLELFPNLKSDGLTGAGIFYDAQMYNPTRLVFSVIRSAANAGAHAANYLQATEFVQDKKRICGIKVRDIMGKSEFEIRSKVVLNATGPWAERLLGLSTSLRLKPELTYSRDACFVVPRRLKGKYAIAVQGRTRDPDAIVSRKHRHLFIVPWRDYTLIGVWHVVHNGSPDDITVSQQELRTFLDEINEAYPLLGLTLEDISLWNAGLVLFGSNEPGATNLSYGKRSRLVDHSREHKVDGLITLIGVRATTARGVAKKAVDMVFRKLGKKSPPCKTAVTPIYGGQVDCFEDFLLQASDQCSPTLGPEIVRPLIHNYGSDYLNVLKYIDEDPTWGDPLGNTKVIGAEIVHAVREEMAEKLADVVFRRTDLGTGGHPGYEALRACADLMASEKGWSEDRTQNELDEVIASFVRFGYP